MARAVLIRNYFEPAEQVALASLVNISIVMSLTHHLSFARERFILPGRT